MCWPGCVTLEFANPGEGSRLLGEPKWGWDVIDAPMQTKHIFQYDDAHHVSPAHCGSPARLPCAQGTTVIMKMFGEAALGGREGVTSGGGGGGWTSVRTVSNPHILQQRVSHETNTHQDQLTELLASLLSI